MMKPGQVWEVIRAKERELEALNGRHEKLLRKRQQTQMQWERQIGINQRRNLELGAAIAALKEIAGKPPAKKKEARGRKTEDGGRKETPQ